MGYKRTRTESSTRHQLLVIYDRLLKAHGPQHWWPGETPFEVMVGAILTQSAAWSNVEKAICNLKSERSLTPEAIRSIPLPELAATIRPTGYYNAKAKKLKALAEWLGEYCKDDISGLRQCDIAAVRSDILAVHGVGPETADSIVLYACNLPAFVIDAYTIRVMTRLGIMPSTTKNMRDSYTAWQGLFTSILPAEAKLFNEYHALLVKHGKDVCRKKPSCPVCPLLDMCAHGYKEKRHSEGGAPAQPRT